MDTTQHKYYLMFLVLAIFWLPLVSRFVPINDTELKGVTEVVKKPAFSWVDWKSGMFQKLSESYYAQQLGLRKAATRLANEIDCRLGVQRKYCIVGKQHELMGLEYIDSYYGRDYIGDDSIRHILSDMLEFKKLLNDSGVIFCVVLAPSKVRLYPDRIPDKFRGKETHKTNYGELSKLMMQSGIPVLDFQPWFNEIDRKSTYALFSNLGVHWSNYAAAICADSLLGYIGQLSHKPLNRLHITGAHALPTATGTDRDMLDILNIYSDIPLTRTLGEIKGEIIVDSNKFIPSVLVVGDSYYWNILYTGIPKYYFSPSSAYYYYNSKAYFNNDVTLPTKEVDVKKACFTKDIVIWLYAEPNLRNIGNDIDNQLINSCKTKQLQ